MSKKYFSILLLTILTVLMYSCKDIIEEDLGKKNVVLLAPADTTKVSTLNITFWWEETEGALGYRLQVVTPSFDRVENLVLDTFVNQTTFAYSFFPGNFQWRLRAENGSSSTPYAVRSFTIDSALDLRNQIVILKSPANNFLSNKTNHKFQWNKIVIADEYRFEILDSDNTILEIKPSLTTDTTSYTFPSDGEYVWRVQASNDKGESTVYSSRNITVDQTPPGLPILISPKNDSILNNRSFTLNWQRAGQAGVVVNQVSDSLYIYTDNTMTTVVRSVLTEQTSYSDSLDFGDYYWRVRSIDAAGNKSNFTTLFRFVLP
jgi:hypothetical protein